MVFSFVGMVIGVILFGSNKQFIISQELAENNAELL